MANKLTALVGFGKGAPSSTKSKALAKKTDKNEHKLKRVHVSDDYCSKCGVKTSRHERYESGHNHFDD